MTYLLHNAGAQVNVVFLRFPGDLCGLSLYPCSNTRSNKFLPQTARVLETGIRIAGFVKPHGRGREHCFFRGGSLRRKKKVRALQFGQLLDSGLRSRMGLWHAPTDEQRARAVLEA